MAAGAEVAWRSGVVVVAAAGNTGQGKVETPGVDPYIITVGALDAQSTKSTSDDVQASWSSRGTTQDGFYKPDVGSVTWRPVSLKASHESIVPNAALGSTPPSRTSHSILVPEK